MATSQDVALGQLTAVFAADWERLENLYDPEVDHHDPDGALGTRAEVIERLKALSEALSGCSHHIRHCTEAGDSAVVEWTLTGGALSLDVATFYGVRDGAIVAERNYWDNTALVHPVLGGR